MRIDVRKRGDLKYIRRAQPFLNGVKVPKCVMADDEQGVIERYATDEQGLITKPLHTITEYGFVRIELAE